MHIVRTLCTIVFFILFIVCCKKTTIGSILVVVTFIDVNIEELIRDILSKPNGEIILLI